MILDAPLNSTKANRITYLRFCLAFYVLFTHSVGWYNYIFHDVNEFYILINNGLIKFFQPAGETNPAVLGFITLSGYCIHRNGLRRTKNNLTEYFCRRFFRIFPVLLFGTICGIVAFSLFKFPSMQLITATDKISIVQVLLKITGVSSFYFKLHQSSFQGNAPLVTAAVEMWLYVFYPLGLYICAKYGDMKLIFLLVINLFLWMIFILQFPELSSWWNNGSFFGFVIYWWIGAYMIQNDNWLFIKKHIIYFLASYIILTAVIYFFSTNVCLVEFRKVIFCFLMAFFIKRIDIGSESVAYKIRAKAIFYRLTASSYSLYAVHVPIIMGCIFYNIQLEIAILIAVIAGSLVFKYIEYPIMIAFNSRFQQDHKTLGVVVL